MFIATVKVTLSRRGKPSESIDCVGMNIGPLPSAFPFRVYKPFPAYVCTKQYLVRLREIGVPPDYIKWLERFWPSNDNAYPPPAYIAPPCFVPPPAQPRSPLHLGPGPAIQPYKIPPNETCVFVTGEFIYPNAMTAVAPSAVLIGAAYLFVSSFFLLIMFCAENDVISLRCFPRINTRL